MKISFLYINIMKIYLMIFLIAVASMAYSQNQVIKSKNDSIMKGSKEFFHEDPIIDLGHGRIVKRRNLTKAIGVMNSKEFIKSPLLYPGNALFGQIPGLWV